MMKLMTGLASAAMFAAISTSSQAAPRTAFVHLFEWQWDDVATECENVLGPKGFSAVQVSPPQKSIMGSQWWTRYQPVSYSIEGRSGSRDQFASMVNRCKAAGVDIYVDAVINHMAAWGRNFPEVPYSYNDFHNNPNCPVGYIDYTQAWQVRECDLSGLNDLKTESDYVRGKIADYLNDLISLGVAGFRIDAAKHMKQDDIANIISRLNGNPYIFQEVIGAPGEADEIHPSTYTWVADVTEFNFTNTVGHYFKRRGPVSTVSNIGSWGGWLASEDAITFVANHDNQRQATDKTITHKDSNQVNDLAHVFMLGWPYGYPKVMSSYDWNDHDQGPPSSGASACNNGWLCEHRRTAIANMVGFRNHTADAFEVTNYWDNGGHQMAWGRGGLGFVAINMESYAMNVTLQTGMAAGVYCDILHGDYDANSKSCSGPTVTVDDGGLAEFRIYSGYGSAIHVGAIVEPCTDCRTEKVKTTFTCGNGHTYWGQSVYAIGSIAELGLWDTASAVKLDPVHYPTWQASIELPANTEVEWKCLKRDEAQSNVGVQWQGGGNNQFNTGTSNAYPQASF